MRCAALHKLVERRQKRAGCRAESVELFGVTYVFLKAPSFSEFDGLVRDIEKLLRKYVAVKVCNVFFLFCFLVSSDELNRSTGSASNRLLA
jgi:hypothetical protein